MMGPEKQLSDVTGNPEEAGDDALRKPSRPL